MSNCKGASIVTSRVNSSTVRVTASGCGITTSSTLTETFGGVPTLLILTRVAQYGDQMCGGTGVWSAYAPFSIRRIALSYPAYPGTSSTVDTCTP